VLELKVVKSIPKGALPILLFRHFFPVGRIV